MGYKFAAALAAPMELGQSTWTDADAAETELALLPVGSTEQHGPHAPLSTDTLIAEAVAAAGVDAYDGEVVVAPALPFGVSEEHRAFAGTLWLSPDAFRAAVRDVVDSLVHHGFRRVVVVNGHGGNVPALGEVAAAVSRSGGAYAVPFTWFRAVDLSTVADDLPALGHAGPMETAIVRAVAPALVREDRIGEAGAGAAERWGHWVGGVNLAHDSDEFSANGAIGDPAAGDAALGEALLAAAGETLAEVLAAVADRPLD